MFFQSSWRCSVCRRKLASRDQPIVTQESTDSLLEVPVLEALQRRHSDARLGCQSGSQIGGLGSGLAPPRSPELRRHSDVSPASLKELEKVSRPLCDVSELCFSNNRASRQWNRIHCHIYFVHRIHFNRSCLRKDVWYRLQVWMEILMKIFCKNICNNYFGILFSILLTIVLYLWYLYWKYRVIQMKCQYFSLRFSNEIIQFSRYILLLLVYFP